ncbi:microcin-processing peptidase 1 [Candidatus Koribacter versatilis Ellin345]|uniref:Microcin-processing peptidase 1 n=1 Tax=Koribacter versatilis (strain Ellin345) TaxID=204669 RepID=Q1IH91_KORVE|nr:TldD/PmbA family protein [Candidatus Koribacter versatilis]ABF43759.1 microcin-processing peptidase 1 [Candidatus Koribacter versatilis Ellin345]
MSTTTPVQSVSTVDLRELSADVVRKAMKGGATAAEVVLRDGSEFSTTVRLGEVETLKESGSRSMGVRVFFGKRSASTWSSDFSPQGIDNMVRGALDLAKITSEDPFSGIPEPEQLGQITTNLDLYYEDVYSLSTADRIDYAKRAERAAMEADPRIQNSDGASFDAANGVKVLANSNGFIGDYSRSYCSVSAVPIAQQEGSAMQRDYWFSVARTLSMLESPEDVGREAARRALRRLGAKKVKTARVPIVFDPLVAGSLLGHIFEAVNGDSVYRGASYLAGKLNEKIAGANVTIVDDGTMVGGFGSSPFDAEGVPTRRTVVIEKGILNSYLLNTYTAKKLKLQTTGNAARGLAGTPGIGAGNFFMEPGTRTPQQIFADVKDGFYVTEFLGSGVNLVTGDFSRGASGVWIQNGELTFPVEEVTVAGNLRDMLHSVVEIGNDLEFRGSVACPTMRIDGMTVGGE